VGIYVKRFIIYFLEILVCYLLQTTLYRFVSLANIMPNILLILIVSVAYMRGRMTGLTIGLFAGLLVDLLYSSYVVGIRALLFMLVGYVIGYTHKYYSDDDYTLPIIIIAISDLFYNFFYYVIEYLLRGRMNFFFYLRRIVFPEIIYTVAVSILLYKLLHIINNHMDRKPEKEV